MITQLAPVRRDFRDVAVCIRLNPTGSPQCLQRLHISRIVRRNRRWGIRWLRRDEGGRGDDQKTLCRVFHSYAAFSQIER